VCKKVLCVGSVEFMIVRDLEVNKLRYLVAWQTIEC
jgi:hypothetical protein